MFDLDDFNVLRWGFLCSMMGGPNFMQIYASEVWIDLRSEKSTDSAWLIFLHFLTPLVVSDAAGIFCGLVRLGDHEL